MHDVQVVSWMEDLHDPQIVISDGGKLSKISLLNINQIRDRVDKDTWGELCWKKGYAQGRCEILELNKQQ